MKILVYLMPVILSCHCDKDFLERIFTKEPPKWSLVNVSKCPAKEKNEDKKGNKWGGENEAKRQRGSRRKISAYPQCKNL